MVQEEELRIWKELSDKYFDEKYYDNEYALQDVPHREMTEEDAIAWDELWCRMSLDGCIMVGLTHGELTQQVARYIETLGIDRVRQLYREQLKDSYSFED